MQKQIILNSAKHVDAIEENTSCRIQLANDLQEVDTEKFNASLNLYNLYQDEREKCNKIRLTAQVNLMATNVLFNKITEIVKNEDNENAICLNFTPKKIDSTIGRNKNYLWGEDISVAVTDSQITYSGKNDKNYTYHCGLDIFGNTVLRALEKYPSTIDNGDNFNTPMAIVGDSYDLRNGSYFDSSRPRLYNDSNFLSFSDALDQKLKDKDGWLGFVNTSIMECDVKNGTVYGTSRILNNEPPGKFIDLYPGKNCYSLIPYQNKDRNRQEKNWEYCLTYPYSSTTKGFACINEELGTLRIGEIEEHNVDDDGVARTVIYSLSKHNLKPDDTINIYKSDSGNVRHELAVENVVVDSVLDEYTFAVYLGESLCDKWISVLDNNQINTFFDSGSTQFDHYVYGPDNQYLTSFNDYINADLDTEDKIGAQNLSFAKVENGEQCEYYVRIFSRFPNFDFFDGEITETAIYNNNNIIKPVDKYAKPEYEKASVLSKLGYAKNAYGDNLAQITYIDDIDISCLHDNLGRPLTSLYLSFFKTNYGHKEWYSGNINNEKVEHSRCFGKLNAGVYYNPNIVKDEYQTGNITFMNNVDNIKGVDQSPLKGGRIPDDEIDQRGQVLFYGDICCYSPSTCIEEVVQDVFHRFNTYQRELAGILESGVLKEKFKPIYLYQYATSYSKSLIDSNPTSCREGYYYKSNYEIPIRTFSEVIKTFNPDSIRVSQLTCEEQLYTITTTSDNYVSLEDNVLLYNVITHKTIPCNIENILDVNKFTFKLNPEDVLDIESLDVNNYRICVKPNNIPNYAQIATDGSGVFRWRDIVQNGFETSLGIIPEYPFTNGCLYINKRINIFLKRQDPFGQFGLTDDIGAAIANGQPSPFENGDFIYDVNKNTIGNDSYVNERNSRC